MPVISFQITGRMGGKDESNLDMNVWSGEPKRPNHERVFDRKTCRTRTSIIRQQAIYISDKIAKIRHVDTGKSVNIRTSEKIDNRKTEHSKSQSHVRGLWF